MNRIQRDGLCLDSKTGEHKLILSILLILSELCLDSEAGAPDSQKETEITETEKRNSVRSVCSCSTSGAGRIQESARTP